MTISATFVNDQTQKPAVYFDRPDLDLFTLRITTDSATPVTVQFVRVKFPVTILPVDAVAQISVSTAGWQKQAAGPNLTLTPTGSVSVSSTAPLVLGLAGVKSSLNSATNDDMEVHVGSEAPKIKLFLMRYPAEAGNLNDALLTEIRPDTIYRTPPDFDKIVNVITLRLTNKSKDTPLVTTAWNRTPTIKLSFVYGDDIGSLTPADPPISDPNSAFNIKVDASATYKNGQQTFEWTVTPPDSGATDTAPVWILRPIPENRQVLGPRSGATAEFRISGISTAAPHGSTQVYLQFSDFPGYSDGFTTLALAKDEPQDAIVYFDGVPNDVAKLGDTVTLEWQTVAMARVELQVAGTKVNDPLPAAHGTYAVKIDRDTDFGLSAFKRVDDTVAAHTAQWTGHVPEARILGFSADKSTVADGTQVVLTWSTSFARAAEIRSASTDTIDAKVLDGGSKPYYPRVPTTYTLHVTGQGDPPDWRVNVFVLPRGWKSRPMGFSPHAGQGPVLYGSDAGLILVGGQSDNAIFQSTDGTQWVQVGVAQFPARNDAAGCMLGSKLWIMGGRSSSGQPTNDVWSASGNGETWTQVVGSAPWAARSGFACVAFNEKLWIFGGQDQNFQPLGDTWSSSDGVNWTRATEGGQRWSPRSGLAVAKHDSKLWLFGGTLADGTVADDLWMSTDGATWTQMDGGNAFGGVTARQRATLGSLGGSLYLFGGIDGQGTALDDFNVFDDGSWDLATGPSAWRTSHAGFTIWRDAFWFAGGLDGNGDSNKVWSWFPG